MDSRVDKVASGPASTCGDHDGEKQVAAKILARVHVGGVVVAALDGLDAI